MVSRRQFVGPTTETVLGAAMVSHAGPAALPEAPVMETAHTQPPLAPSSGRAYNPVVTLNGGSAPWRLKSR